MQPNKLYKLANVLLIASLVIIVVGTTVGFLVDDYFSLRQQVLAHISIMLGAGFLKLAYVMRLNASWHLKIHDYL